MMNSGKVRTCRPSAFYWRKAIREARTKRELNKIAMQMVLDLEAHKEAIRMHGLVPPKRVWAPGEKQAKAQVIHLPLQRRM